MPYPKTPLASLGITPVEAHNPLPLYFQVNSDLKSIILSGRLQPGDMLPPELELCKVYGVGRQTIREAISRLVNENLVERFAGRGTFVSSQTARTQFYLDRSFTQQMAELGLASHARVLSISTGEIDGNAPVILRPNLGSPCLHLTRLRFGGGQPVGLQESTFLTTRCPGIEKVDFTTASLYGVLASQFHLPISTIDHVVSAVAANPRQASLLQTAPGAPLMLVKTTAFLEHHDPIEATISYYRSDRYEFHITDSFHL